jgi:pimeloyl-ACP methyl ester carboxylesterase
MMNKYISIYFLGGFCLFSCQKSGISKEKLQEQNVASLSIDFRDYGNSKSGNTNKKMFDIQGAITWLKNNGFNDISIIGGSMGGAAVLSALETNKIPVTKVILLGPADGPPVISTLTRKLFVVSKEESLYNTVMDIYQKSASPKGIEVYPGNVYAQHIFKTDFAEKLEKLILDFIGPA